VNKQTQSDKIYLYVQALLYQAFLYHYSYSTITAPFPSPFIATIYKPCLFYLGFLTLPFSPLFLPPFPLSTFLPLLSPLFLYMPIICPYSCYIGRYCNKDIPLFVGVPVNHRYNQGCSPYPLLWPRGTIRITIRITIGASL